MDPRYNNNFVPPTRAPSAAPSMAASDLTFYTARNQFYDVETLDEEAPSPPPQKRVSSSRNSHRRRGSRASLDRPATAQAIKRHDSGYGSNGHSSNGGYGYTTNVVSPRPSVSQYRPATAHAKRPSTNALNQQGRTGQSTRRRVPKAYQASNNDSGLHLARPSTSAARNSSTFFHFPAANDPLAAPRQDFSTHADFTTHAPTQYRARSRSRHTDYQTIDDSRGGFGGWLKRAFGCMSAKEPRGSVRHYRPEMDDSYYEEKRAPHPQGWQGQPLKMKSY
ncbi:unnamed protein product [Clonostachys solani]|uniref:Uncharacterized protein n=1 Tax=Clonostachys solani TaxID=160281 RepID=A0A9N9Z8X0_9HYPO|nr:unnamed protein product [Clonostachys solani]